ncbi:hypothetical protein AAG747_09370 [Rapidithrix thailandica]|uniref:Uncharacterized protein n=1 Tax=Rapidithrix thailandica TaxID=413964 RepID=A0AAW9S8P0_9BACT
MNKNIKFRNFLGLAVMALGLFSCYEEDNFLEDNITDTGRSFPNIYMNEIQSEYLSGEKVTVELEFFSDDPIKEIKLYEIITTEDDTDTTLLSTNPYQPAFSKVKSQDTLVLYYEVPVIDQNTEITLDAEVINENTLTDNSARTFKVK